MSTQSRDASQQMLHIATSVASHGFAVIPVGYGGCSVPGCCGSRARYPWTYTVGLVEAGLPELVLFGLDPVSAHYCMSLVVEEIRSGRPVVVDTPLGLESMEIKLVDVPDRWLMADPGRMAMWFNHYGPGRSRLPAPQVRQLVWADNEERYPDDPFCDPEVVEMQPIVALDPVRYPKIRPRRIKSRHKGKRRR